MHELLSEKQCWQQILTLYSWIEHRTFYPHMWWMNYEHTLEQWIVDSFYTLITGITYPHSL